MNKETALKLTKITVFVMFLISLGVLYQYEYKVKGHYDSNPESYERDTNMILSYMSDKGCVSTRSLSKHTNLSYIQARYLLTELSKERMVLKYPRQGICLSLQAKVQLGLERNQ